MDVNGGERETQLRSQSVQQVQQDYGVKPAGQAYAEPGATMDPSEQCVADPLQKVSPRGLP